MIKNELKVGDEIYLSRHDKITSKLDMFCLLVPQKGIVKSIDTLSDGKRSIQCYEIKQEFNSDIIYLILHQDLADVLSIYPIYQDLFLYDQIKINNDEEVNIYLAHKFTIESIYVLAKTYEEVLDISVKRHLDQLSLIEKQTKKRIEKIKKEINTYQEKCLDGTIKEILLNRCNWIAV